jgi:hypothetical protein
MNNSEVIDNEEIPLSKASELALDEYLQLTRVALIENARASDPKADEISILRVSKAIEQHAATKLPEPKFHSEFSPALKIYASLAIVFAVLGLWAILGSGSAANLKELGFLDIAKIFAGAIVGSATVASTTSYRKANKSLKQDK